MHFKPQQSPYIYIIYIFVMFSGHTLLHNTHNIYIFDQKVTFTKYSNYLQNTLSLVHMH